MQLVQIVGALAILAAFAAAQFGWLDQRSWAYLVLNAAGALVLDRRGVRGGAVGLPPARVRVDARLRLGHLSARGRAQHYGVAVIDEPARD